MAPEKETVKTHHDEMYQLQRKRAAAYLLVKICTALIKQNIIDVCTKLLTNKNNCGTLSS